MGLVPAMKTYLQCLVNLRQRTLPVHWDTFLKNPMLGETAMCKVKTSGKKQGEGNQLENVSTFFAVMYSMNRDEDSEVGTMGLIRTRAQHSTAQHRIGTWAGPLTS